MLFGAAYFVVPDRPPLFGKDNLFGNLLSVIGTLPGFYFAALAAVATFDRPGMDNEIDGPGAPTIDVVVKGVSGPVVLTRRMLLTYLFSYLTTLSLALCALLLALNALQPTAATIKTWMLTLEYGRLTYEVSNAFILLLVVLPVSALAVGTLHGIYFLTERIHQPY